MKPNPILEVVRVGPIATEVVVQEIGKEKITFLYPPTRREKEVTNKVRLQVLAIFYQKRPDYKLAQKSLFALRDENTTILPDGRLKIIRWNKKKEVWTTQIVKDIFAAIRMQDKIINRCAASEIKCYQTVMRRKPVLEVEKNRLDNVIRQAISSLTLCSQIKPPLEPAIQKIKKDITEAKKILATAWIMPYSAIAMQTLNSLKMAEKNLKKEMEKSVFFIKEALEILKTDVKTGGK